MTFDYYNQRRIEIARKRKLEREAEAAKKSKAFNVSDRKESFLDTSTRNNTSTRQSHSKSSDADILQDRKQQGLVADDSNDCQLKFKPVSSSNSRSKTVSANDYLQQFLASKKASSISDSQIKSSIPLKSSLNLKDLEESKRSSVNHKISHSFLQSPDVSALFKPSKSLSSVNLIPTSVPASKSQEGRIDPLKQQLEFFRKKKQQQASDAFAEDHLQSKDDFVSQKVETLIVDNIKKSPCADDESSEDDIHMDLYEYSKKQRRKKNITSKIDVDEVDSDTLSNNDSNYHSEDTKRTDAREKQRDIHQVSSRKRSPHSDFRMNTIHITHNSDHVDIWSDSDDSEGKIRREDVNVSTSAFQKYSKERRSTNSSLFTTQLPSATREMETKVSDIDIEEAEDLDDESLMAELKPNFENPRFDVGKFEPFVLSCSMSHEDQVGDFKQNDVKVHQVPASISRYIQTYQKEGIEFMYQSVIRGKGCILGHDMGLGKTVQLIALLSALQEKSGTKLDRERINECQRKIKNQQKELKDRARNCLLQGIAISNDNSRLSGQLFKDYSPVLVIVPSSVLKNWNNEFHTWGHFSVSTYYGEDKADAIERVKIGMDDILLCGRPTVQNEKGLNELLLVPWKLIVVDEFHDYKSQTSQSYKSLLEIRNRHKSPIIGLTGTLMSNNLKELWTLVNLVRPQQLGNWKEFKLEYERPIQLSRVKDAKDDAIRLGKERSKELHDALRDVYQKREKSVVLEDFLPTKNQIIMFCKVTDIQKRIYQHILHLPEYDLLKKSNAPCDCGVNRSFFIHYQSLSSRKQKDEYYRRFRKNIVRRKNCCYQKPEGEGLVFWPAQHPDGNVCKSCPSCILFPAMTKLDKLCSHAALIQVSQHPSDVADANKREKLQKDLEFAKAAIPKDILKYLGGSYIRDSSILGNHTALSGKLRKLKELLTKYRYQQDKVLVFSYSSETLDLIESLVKLSGFCYLRLDGKTPTTNRQVLVDKFQNDDKITLFIISTKAGGMGLNLTAANRVIIYDVNWSPSHDDQAQDRAFRIGQNRNVEVIRLIAQGTIEEKRYERQLYKTHLKQESLESSEYAVADTIRMFSGVQGDNTRKGELFGLENLLKFQEQSFTIGKGIWKSKSADPSLCTLALEGKEMEKCFEDDDSAAENEEFIEAFNHDCFLRDDGRAINKDHDEEEVGGATQMAHEVLGGNLTGLFGSDETLSFDCDRANKEQNKDDVLSDHSEATENLISTINELISNVVDIEKNDSNHDLDVEDKKKVSHTTIKNDVSLSLWNFERSPETVSKRKPVCLFIRKQDR